MRHIMCRYSDERGRKVIDCECQTKNGITFEDRTAVLSIQVMVDLTLDRLMIASTLQTPDPSRAMKRKIKQ